ncbi:hypothetical protein Tco_1186083 [Tanacetum coccineum]
MTKRSLCGGATWVGVGDSLGDDEESFPSRKIRVIRATLFTRNHEGFKSNTPYPGTSIRCIQDLLYTKILEDIKRDPYSKKSPIRRIPHGWIRRIERFPRDSYK